ncbi:PHB depolymerase family esterase [Streptomyces sp. NPDC046925]|uniref:extracellular catalytic domain type 1 short-chain-length polyhydroxyalkanoate depolymerase n=1 Tax=Streptomyces sp. NPDC046925 TaxID=3155375 RepID=UPI0033FA60F8
MKRRPLTALLAAVITTSVAVATAPGAGAAPAPGPGGPGSAAGQSEDHTKRYSGPEGALRYQVHVPPAQAAGRPLPVVVSLHGCAMTGFGLNSMKATTNLNALADEKGFLVVYPTQDTLSGLPMNCWRGAKPEHQRRGHGEPAMIAGIVKEVLSDYDADPKRVHVNGASSGAGTAVIMGVTYPDMFATVTSAAGAEYAVNEADPEDPDEVGPVDTAKRAWAQMGRRARPVPVLVVQGDKDKVVKPFLADRLVTHWAAIDDLAMNGRLDGQMDDKADKVVNVSPPGLKSYTHKSYFPRTGGRSLVEYIVVAGMEHRWPGPGSGAFVDNNGPDLARVAWDFAAPRTLP